MNNCIDCIHCTSIKKQQRDGQVVDEHIVGHCCLKYQIRLLSVYEAEFFRIHRPKECRKLGGKE